MIEIIRFVENSQSLIKNIINEINKTLCSMEDIKQNRSYVANKKNFNLYWNLEALSTLADKIIINDDIIQLIKTTYKSNDYTIREKTAKLISYLNTDLFSDIIQTLKNDENIYVKKYFEDYDIIAK